MMLKTLPFRLLPQHYSNSFKVLIQRLNDGIEFEVELSGIFQGIKQIDYMSHILLIYPKFENEGSVYSPVASYVAENGLVEANELSGIADALCTNIDLSTSSLFLPFTHLRPHIFDTLASIFLPKHYSDAFDLV